MTQEIIKEKWDEYLSKAERVEATARLAKKMLQEDPLMQDQLVSVIYAIHLSRLWVLGDIAANAEEFAIAENMTKEASLRLWSRSHEAGWRHEQMCMHIRAGEAAEIGLLLVQVIREKIHHLPYTWENKIREITTRRWN